MVGIDDLPDLDEAFLRGYKRGFEGPNGETTVFRMWREAEEHAKHFGMHPYAPQEPESIGEWANRHGIVVRSHPTCTACGEENEDTTSPLCSYCLASLNDVHAAHVPADEKTVWQPTAGIGRDAYRLGWWTGDAWRGIFVWAVVKPIHALCCLGVGLLHALCGIAAEFLEDER